MKQAAGIGVAVCAALLVPGCATITSGSAQSVVVETVREDGAEVQGVLCRVSNAKGGWVVTTPGSLYVNKAYADADVVCEPKGEPLTRAKVQSGTRGATFGNILVGGLIGAGVDAMSGAAWSYPILWRIVLGRPEQFIGANGEQLSGEPLLKALDESARKLSQSQ